MCSPRARTRALILSLSRLFPRLCTKGRRFLLAITCAVEVVEPSQVLVAHQDVIVASLVYLFLFLFLLLFLFKLLFLFLFFFVLFLLLELHRLWMLRGQRFWRRVRL